jgi:hypothetical protein
MLTTVKNRELLEFLKKAGVKKVVLDNMYPNHIDLMKALCEAGLEVEAITRLTAQEEFRSFVRRKVEVLKRQESTSISNSIRTTTTTL